MKFLKNKQHQIFLLISLIFLILYSNLSLINHYNFRTNAYDLGIFNQTLWGYSQFELKANTIREVPNLLADHFEPILILFSPLVYLFGSYTLLIIQIIALILGGLGVYLLLLKKTKQNYLLILSGSLIFFLFFGVFDALNFDYHNNVIASALIPWLLYFFTLKNYKAYYLILTLFLLTKENMALISLFIGLSILIFENKKQKIHGLITAVISLSYFFLVIKILIPFFNPNHNYVYLSSYSRLGDSFLEISKNIILNPIENLKSLFDHEIKLKMWRLILISGGFLALFYFRYSIILIPIVFQKFLSQNQIYWGHLFQYSVEFAPFIALGSILILKKLKLNSKLALILVALNIFVLFSVHFHDRTRITKIFLSDHYFLDYDREVLKQALDKIPQKASVSAQNSIVPHLAFRDEIYLFPKINDSEYIILNFNDDNLWPIKNLNDLKQEKNKIDQNKNYELIFFKKGIYLYRRKALD
jgi:uncharacterized membrane protein